MRRLSIIIPNYNYGRFVAQAIESALAVDWPDVEVIVVDDGSTDDSREQIAAYADHITVIHQDNAGPRVACNTGFAASTGDAVVFLDSDDLLEPTIARESARVWGHAVSKVQFPMLRIDGDGVPVGTSFPRFGTAPTPDQIRGWMRATGEYPTPPGSGNVYARSFLERLFPLGDRCGGSSDSSCLAAAPYLGDVITLTEPQARYRLHGDNRSYVLTDPARFSLRVERAVQRHQFALEVSGNEADGLAPLFRGRHLLQLRVAGRRLRPDDRPLPGDSAARMLRDALTSPFAPGPDGVAHRVLVSTWSLATLTAPGPVARRLIDRRFRQPVAG
ncbi:glycosyltransferase family 2 protein [Demequina capsici]|uniref:Glycosyltransferase family A protein n=1 Tax=Demequina capsici TaxID=3075620 RepID=A0AA96F8F8_9MICO|nr:glycosyltransferase family A protein [Demequina sp. OYTSA14]WNM25509.1 glycosyltransferase family A protein [Demequina sp. OYTSA14]